MKGLAIGLILTLLLLSVTIYAHQEYGVSKPIGFDPVDSIFYTIAIISIIVVISLVFRNKLKDKHKKVLFILIVLPVLFSTAYLAGSTVYVNTISESKGPVHWHADLEIWICGEKTLLEMPHGLDNKIGTAVLHHHNEGESLNGTYRIHAEGVLVKLSEASLGHFFDAIGGELIEDSITVKTLHGDLKTWKNGDSCTKTGKQGKLKVLVNDKEIVNAPEYIISPYQNVPPGDFIKIIFE